MEWIQVFDKKGGVFAQIHNKTKYLSALQQKECTKGRDGYVRDKVYF